MPIRAHPWLKLTLWGLPLALLWWRLLNHLRLEWTANPQYTYGWAVPFLCAYLLWQRGRDTLISGQRVEQASFVPTSPVVGRPFFLRSALALCAFLYLPTRLVQEANPEWRLVSWALALEVIGLTLLTIRLARPNKSRVSGPCLISYLPSSHPRFQLSALSISDLVFPVCFFLVAVPWPTFLEAPLIQWLTRANIDVTTDLLGAIGIPAVRHGNVIEIGTGLVGIDDACSGIRSFQATLMISLFFGEVYALSIRLRALCALAGFALAFLFNVGRTLLLTSIASAKGVETVASWHDPAGVTILVACFLSLWLLALWLRRGTGGSLVFASLVPADPPAGSVSVFSGKPSNSCTGPSNLDVQPSTFEVRPSLPASVSSSVSAGGEGQGEVASPASDLRPLAAGLSSPCCPSSLGHVLSWSCSIAVPLSLLAWLVFAEVGTELWYLSHEWGVPKTTNWRVELPRDNPTFRELPPSDKARQILRYDEQRSGVWQAGADRRWQAIFLRWNPGRTAVHLARSHTPEICLKAAGREVSSQSDVHTISVHGLQLPFRSYVVRNKGAPLRVFHCLWEDRASVQSFDPTRMTYANRLSPVLAGRRNPGQRSLEVAVWGILNQQEAEAALARELEKLIRIEN